MNAITKNRLKAFILFTISFSLFGIIHYTNAQRAFDKDKWAEAYSSADKESLYRMSHSLIKMFDKGKCNTFEKTKTLLRLGEFQSVYTIHM